MFFKKHAVFSRKLCGRILVMILGLSMIICVSIDVPLHAGHDVLFGIFICVLVLSTFLLGK